MTHTRAKLSQLVAVPILPLPAVTGYYLSPRHETFIFRPFTGETRRKPRAFATFRLALFTTFFTAQMGRGKIQWGAFTKAYATTRLCCKEFRFVDSDSEQATVQNFERVITRYYSNISNFVTHDPTMSG